MIRDVFYYGQKPNVHPREQYAKSLSHARQLATTEHFWIINEYCDYSKFDWDWDFDFLPDDEVWTSEYNNVWPSTRHKDSGTWLCPKQDTETIIYRADVNPVSRKNIKHDNWVVVDKINELEFDFSWEPNPYDPPYIYKWGSKFYPTEIKHHVEYHVEGATTIKYMHDSVELLPDWDKWVEVQAVDKSTFDFSWRPDPREPAYIYTWGNKYISNELQPTLEYHCEGATERKYMDNSVGVLPLWDKWVEVQAVNKSSFDFSWRPDPREPAYIYTWGNKYINAEIAPTLEYHCEGATERKYMDNSVGVLPEWDKWVEVQAVDKSSFDFSWRPDPREPAYIYTWGNKYISAEISPTLEYHVDGATERKYMDNSIGVLPEWDKWKLWKSIDTSIFNFTWRPDPREPAYIYVFGNTQYPGEIMPTVEYYVTGATERKYINDESMKATLLPNSTRFEHLENCDGIDYSWQPNPWSPPYIYAWGNQWNKPEDKISIQYVVEGATEYKYMEERATRKPCMDNWQIPPYVIKNSFDFSWEPDLSKYDPPYIYQFGTVHQKTGGPRYVVPGATEVKYIDVIKAEVIAWRFTNWLIPRNVDQKTFDWSWHPDETEPPYIYQFPSTWSKTGGPKFTVEGATETKYLDYPIAKVKQDMTHWSIPAGLDTSEFDFSWHPNIDDDPLVYQFGTQWQKTDGPIFTAPLCDENTPVKYMDLFKAKRLPNKTNWIIPAGFDDTTFDFSWHPDSTTPPYIYQFGTLLEDIHLQDGPKYVTPGNDGHVILLENLLLSDENIVYPQYYIETTLKALIEQHKDEIFWALRKNIDYTKFDFSWKPTKEQVFNINTFGSPDSETTQTYLVNGKMWQQGYKDISFIENKKLDEEYLSKLFKPVDAFFVDKGNKESAIRFELLKLQFPTIQKTRYLNSWVDTINRCINKSTTELCWILNSELDYTDFAFNYYPNPWQMTMVHVFGTQWSHWGSTFMVNKETFAEDTKYVKIIEHLSNLNFVKTKRALATNCTHDVYIIDYGNDSNVESLIKNKCENVYTITYKNNYLTTLKSLLNELDTKRDHYIWVCSSICDYTNFDFTYICDPFSMEQLHVFPSDKQKFGDTFFINVNKLRILVEDLDKLENIEKINFNQHQRVKRLPAPSFITDDTHLNFKKHTYNFPYAIFTTSDNVIVSEVNDEPISMWSKESKNILITNKGGTRVIIPKEATDYVEKELYDYPYIAKSTKMGQSKPLDIVFLSNGEIGADENYEHLLKVTDKLPNRVVRVDGINGRVASYHAAANASSTPWMFTVFAKLRVNSKFDWTWQPDRLQIPKHYIFYASNPVNGLLYGHQAMIAYNKQITLSNMGKGLDFTLDNEHEVVDINSGVANYNTDEFSTWRTSFREAIKLRLEDSTISRHRLNIWSTVGEGDFAQYSIQGAQHAVEYFEQVNGELNKLRLSYDWPWLQEYFNTKYN